MTHQFSALAFYTAGTAQVEQRVRWHLTAGDVLIVPAGEPHRTMNGEGVEAWRLAVCGPCLPRTQAPQLLAPFERVRAGGSAVVHVPRPRRAYLARLFRELQFQMGRAVSARLDVPHSLLTLIIHEVEQAASVAHDAVPASGMVADTLRVIEQRCLARVSLSEIAAAVGRSPAHVTTALRRATGRTVVGWITAFRLAQARHLLLHTDVPVDDVAFRVGYGDTTHFIRAFRKEHGMTPAAWRHQSQGRVREPVARQGAGSRGRESMRDGQRVIDSRAGTKTSRRGQRG